jgi:hypothetical protein
MKISYIYTKAKEYGLTDINRWEDDIEHHPKSREIMEFISDHDFFDYNDYFCWKYGGDGDNGEALMYQLDAYFETLDKMERLKKDGREM